MTSSKAGPFHARCWRVETHCNWALQLIFYCAEGPWLPCKAKASVRADVPRAWTHTSATQWLRNGTYICVCGRRLSIALVQEPWHHESLLRMSSGNHNKRDTRYIYGDNYHWRTTPWFPCVFFYILCISRTPWNNSIPNSRVDDNRKIAETSEKLAKSLPGPLVKLSN